MMLHTFSPLFTRSLPKQTSILSATRFSPLPSTGFPHVRTDMSDESGSDDDSDSGDDFPDLDPYSSDDDDDDDLASLAALGLLGGLQHLAGVPPANRRAPTHVCVRCCVFAQDTRLWDEMLKSAQPTCNAQWLLL